MMRRAGTGARPGLAPAAWVLGALLGLTPGCAHTPRPTPALEPGSVPAAHPRVAFLPLENLSGRADVSDVLSRIFHSELTSTGRWDVVEPGDVESALEELRIRNTGTLSKAQLTDLGHRLQVSYVLVGSVLESGVVHSADGDVPSVGVTIRLLDTGAGRAVWSRMGFRTGEDKETVFGWGRETSAERLGAMLAKELFKDLIVPPAGAPAVAPPVAPVPPPAAARAVAPAVAPADSGEKKP